MTNHFRAASRPDPRSTWQMLEEEVGQSSRETTPPNLPYGHVPRPRLIDMILRPFHARVTLIVAGAGYGKTILATELAARLDVQVGWLTLSASDNDEHMLIHDLRAALRPCLRRGRLSPPPGMTDDHALLEQDLADIEQGNCLILDNCEVLTNAACHQLLSDVIAGLPDRCTIVLVSRATPPIALGRLRASGLLREINDTHLRFTRAESAAFFAGLPDIQLDPGEAVRIHQFTEGWAVGLYLVSLAARTHAMTLLSDSDRSLVLHQFVDEYVQQELLAPLSDQAWDFLIATIELPTVTPAFCEHALGIANAHLRMVGFEAEFPFVVVLPGNPRRWTWPHMIRESLLRITNAAENRIAHEDRHHRVVEVLHRHGALQDAADYALIGGDPAWIAASVRPWCEHLALRSDFEPLGVLMARLPDAVMASHPDFSYWRAIADLGIERHYAVIEWFPSVEEAWLRSDDSLLRGRAYTCRSMMDRLAGHHPESIAAAGAALAILPDRAVTERLYAMTTKARVLFRDGDDDGAAHAYLEAERLASTLPIDEQWVWRTLAPDRANAYALRGDLHSATTKYRLIVSELPESMRFLEGFYRCRLVSLAIEQADLTTARREYEHIERLLEGPWRLWHLWAIVAHTRLLIAEGDMDTAEAWAAGHIKVMRRMPGKAQLVMQLARIWLHHGEYAMVQSWLNDLHNLPFPWIDTFGEISHLQLQIDLDLAEGRYRAAADAAERLALAAERSARWAECITYSVRWALAVSLMHDAAHAGPILRKIVSRGDRGGFSRGYQVPGFDLEPLLAQARSHTAAHTPNPAPPAQGQGPLTPREYEVLQLVARGRSNQQIAQELFISANTVRNHLVHICRRLDATSRVEAVAKARDLGVIS